MSFITWNNEVKMRLETGSIKKVLLFGDSLDRPDAPYVVIKPVAGEDRKLFRIIVHMDLGSQDLIEAYIFRELPLLLKEPLTCDGKVIKIRDTGVRLGPYVDEGDNSPAMSADFYIPIRL